MQLVQDAKSAWKWFSVQALALLATISLVWPALPPETQALVPEPWRPWILGAVAIGGLGGRLIDQAKRSR